MIGSKTAWYLVLEMTQGAKKLKIPVFEGFFFEGNTNSCVARADDVSCNALSFISLTLISAVRPNGRAADNISNNALLFMSLISAVRPNG